MQPSPLPVYLFDTGDTDAAASGGDAVVTYTAVADKAHIITGIVWSYSGDPVSGGITIEDGSGNIVFQFDVTKGGAGFIPLGYGAKGNINTDLIITLLDGSQDKKLTVLGHRTE